MNATKTTLWCLAIIIQGEVVIKEYDNRKTMLLELKDFAKKEIKILAVWTEETTLNKKGQ